jgi:hypothetical protein
MSKMFQRGVGLRVQYHPMFNLSETDEINLHFGEGSRPHYESMAEHYLMFNHGWSPSFASGKPSAATSACSMSRKGCRRTIGRRTQNRSRVPWVAVDEPRPLKILRLRVEIGELGGAINRLRRSGMDSAAAELLVTRKRAELEDLLNAKTNT